MGKKLFGTDGIRGVAGKSPLMAPEITRVGQAAAEILRVHTKDARNRVLMVRDTRESSESILRSLSDGFRDLGVDVYDGGVLCTPSVAYLVNSHRFNSGVAISASHNPPEFNGIKFFTPQGRKWPDEWEREVERCFFKMNASMPRSEKGGQRGVLIDARVLMSDYEEFLLGTLPRGTYFSHFKVALDCSHGANSRLAPRLVRRLGAQVVLMGAKPDGRNINVACGSQSVGGLRKRVLKNHCDIGIAFDGDGDRVIFIDEKGNLIDGDHIIGLLARYLKKRKALRHNRAVITVMANLGLKVALAKMGVRAVETVVGDRFVSEAMRHHDLVLGGEQSGHIILGQYLPTGDGLLTALHVLEVMRHEKKSLSQLAQIVRKYPQVLKNVRIKDRLPIPQLDGVQARIRRIEKSLGRNGRVLVRYSGTEPLLRIMLEGPSEKELATYAEELVEAVEKAR